MKSDRNICIRYYCWNNCLTDEVLVGCIPGGSIKAGTNAQASGSADIFGGPFIGRASGIASGNAGADIGFTGPSFTSIIKNENNKADAIDLNASSKSEATADASASGSNKARLSVTKNEDNGVVTEHVIIGSSVNFLNAANAFTGTAGYTPFEQNAIKMHGSAAISADGSISLFHDPITIIHSDDSEKQESLIAEIETKHEAVANAAAETAAKLSAAIVDEGAICVDESGQERRFGETWVYASDACETCTCFDSGQLRCSKKVCDPYPICPDGQFIVEEKVDDCCMSYRIVKDECDVSVCEHKAPKCSFYETLQIYPIDDCCALYECACDPSSCPDLGDPACPDGCVRVIVDSDQCCKVGKCVDISANAEASANAATVLTAGGISIKSEGLSSKTPSSIKASLETDASADASSNVVGGQQTSVRVNHADDYKKHSESIFSLGQFNLGAESQANSAGSFDMFNSYMVGKGELRAGANAETGLSVGGGFFKTIKTGNDDLKSKFGLSSKQHSSTRADAKADVRQNIDLLVDQTDNEEKFVKTTFVPGSIIGETNAKAQVENDFGFFDLPNKFEGSINAAGQADSGISFNGDMIKVTHFNDDVVDSEIKTAQSSAVNARANAQVQASNEAKISVSGDKKTSFSHETIIHDDEFNFGTQTVAQANGNFGHFGSFLGSQGTLQANADSKSNFDFTGKPVSIFTFSDNNKEKNINLSMQNKQSASSKANVKASSALSLQIAEEPSLCIDETGVERKFGECWHKNGNTCTFCSCINADTIECKDETCDPYPPKVEGKVIVEEKTSECCYSYRYVEKTCEPFKCQYQPIICSPFERMVSYAIDECCSTYECVCDESKCFNSANPTCPEGSTRMVIDHDTCCSFGKCVYTDVMAAANSYALANIKGGLFSTVTSTGGNKKNDVGLSYSSQNEAAASAKSNVASETSISVTKPSKKGSTIVTTFVPGQTAIGSSAMADATGNFGWVDFGVDGKWKSKASANSKSGLDFSAPSLQISTTSGDVDSNNILVNMLSSAKSQSTADAKGKSTLSGEIIDDEGTCIDNTGKSRCFGEQWCLDEDVCTICTCYDVDNIRCSKRECDPAPIPPEGHKVVEEKNGGCCSTYRIVREACDTSECQFSAPKCKINEILKTYPLDKCCSTYECVCHRNSCPFLPKIPCPHGCTRQIIDPYACCPVEKCIRDVSIFAEAQNSAEVGGMFGIFNEIITGEKPFEAEISGISKNNAEAGVAAKAVANTELFIEPSKGNGKSSTLIQFSGGDINQETDSSSRVLGGFGFMPFMEGNLKGEVGANANLQTQVQGDKQLHSIFDFNGHSKTVDLKMSNKLSANADTGSKGSTDINLNIVSEDAMCTDENGVERYYGETWYKNGDACNLCTCTGVGSVECVPKTCDPYPIAPEGSIVVEEKADDCCYSYRIVQEKCDISTCTEYAPICNHYEDLITYKVDECCVTYECACNPSKCFTLQNPSCPKGCVRKPVDTQSCCPIGKCININVIVNSQVNSNINLQAPHLTSIVHGSENDDTLIAGSLKSNMQSGANTHVNNANKIKISGEEKKNSGHVTDIIYKMDGISINADARAQAEGQFHGMPYFFGGKGRFGSDASANSGLSITPGFMQVITKDGEGSGSKVDVSTESGLSAGAVAGASGSQATDLLVETDGGKGRYTETVFVPGKMMAGADAQAQAQGKLGGYGLFGPFGGDLHADADAQSKLNYDSGMLKVVHYGDDVLGDEIKADLKGDYVAAAGAIAKGQQEADISVIGDKKGGYSQEIIYQPGKFDLGADARAQAEGQFHGMPYFFGGKGQFGSDASANSGLSMTPGFMQVITKDGEGSGNKVDVSTESGHAAGAVAGASGSQATDLLVETDGGKGRYTETVFIPGQIKANSKADAGVFGNFDFNGLPGKYFADANANSLAFNDMSYAPGMLHIANSNSLDDGTAIATGLSSKANAEANEAAKSFSSVDVLIEADICVDNQGRDRKYGDTWTDDENHCKFCTCTNADDVK